jgi:general secretion pathway protein G
MSEIRKNRTSEKGFTLIELIVVLVILALLAAVVVPNITKHLADSKTKIARIQITELESALQLFAFDVGRYPTNAEGLQALVSNPGNVESWKGPYVKSGTLPMDPWDKPYIYRSPGNHSNEFDLYTLGPSGTEGQGNEIGNWK